MFSGPISAWSSSKLVLTAVGRLFGKGTDPDVADIPFRPRAHRLDVDDLADDRDIEGFDAGPAHADDDLGIGLAPHAVDGLGQGQPQHGLFVDVGDQVARQDAGPVRRGVVDGRDNLHEAVFHGHFDPESAEPAARLHLHFLELVGTHVAGMGVEGLQHPVERGVDQGLVVDRFHVVFADPLKDLAEQVELAIGLTIGRAGAALLVGRAGTDQHDEECSQGACTKVEARAGQAGHGHFSAKARAAAPPLRKGNLEFLI